ncbi:MAG: hypothetical protein LBP53_05525 [Candidatus Peribacteria bacterium]|jgi:hypothetical protein|nr:hypothetical protein [Candidatus Peribacteria bacterium]
MQKPTQIFTPDALFSLQNAQLISSLSEQNETSSTPTAPAITAEQLFRGSYAFIRETDQFETFATMLGLQHANHFDQFYQTQYHPLIKGRPLAEHGHLEIEKTLNQQLLQHKKDWKINQIDFCFLFYTSFLHLSNENQILQLLNTDQCMLKTTKKNCENLLFNPISRQQ